MWYSIYLSVLGPFLGTILTDFGLERSLVVLFFRFIQEIPVLHGMYQLLPLSKLIKLVNDSWSRWFRLKYCVTEKYKERELKKGYAVKQCSNYIVRLIPYQFPRQAVIFWKTIRPCQTRGYIVHLIFGRCFRNHRWGCRYNSISSGQSGMRESDRSKRRSKCTFQLYVDLFCRNTLENFVIKGFNLMMTKLQNWRK